MPKNKHSEIDRPAAEPRLPPWYAAMVRDLSAISPDLVYDPVAGGNAVAAPLLRELRSIARDITSARAADPVHQAAAQRRGLQFGQLPHRTVRLPATEPKLPDSSTRARLHEIAAQARAALDAIERNRRYRDLANPAGALTLYQSQDLPRRETLNQVLRAARSLARQISTASKQPSTSSVEQRRPRAPFRAQLPLSMLYERWVYLQLVGALQSRLQAAGEPALSVELEAAAFVVHDSVIRIRLEPWIPVRELAIAGGHALYRAGAATHPWRPDVIIQIERGARAGIPIVEHAYVIDAKLASSSRDAIWEQVVKYRYICAAIDDRRVVRTIALALPTSRPAAELELQHRSARIGVNVQVLPLMPGGMSTAGPESLDRLVAEVLSELPRK
ncbi:MAG: hypothetical protein WEE89_22470 [Gemmatimonadota bacterium]